MESRSLTCEGRLLATVDLADSVGYDRDEYDHVFLFKNDGGYELLVVGRRERYLETGRLDRAVARVDVTAAPSAPALEEVVKARWSASSEAWWQLLERGRGEDPDLNQLWLPERIRRDLDLSGVYDQELATKTGYLGGHDLDAPGRLSEDWREKAVAVIALLLTDRGWKVRPGPEVSQDVEPGGIFSIGTEVVGSLWGTRHGHEVPLIVRVDDCGEIYPRLADRGDVVPENALGRLAVEGRSRGLDEPVPLGDAVSALVEQLRNANPSFGIEP